MKHSAIRFTFGFFLAITLYGCAPEHHVYSAEPVYARVVDADTGEPLEGVAVVAYWELYQGSITGDGMPCGAANVEEAVTDKDGWFHIPGWGPVKGRCGMMRNMNPFVYLFKSGYAYVRKGGGVGLNTNKLVSVAQVDWNGQTIKLKKFKNLDLGTYGLNSYADNFGDFNSEISTFIVNMPGQCNWKKIPHMLHAIIVQRKSFDSANNHHFDSIDLMLTRNDQDKFMQKFAPQCGSPRIFVDGLEQ